MHETQTVVIDDLWRLSSAGHIASCGSAVQMRLNGSRIKVMLRVETEGTLYWMRVLISSTDSVQSLTNSFRHRSVLFLIPRLWLCTVQWVLNAVECQLLTTVGTRFNVIKDQLWNTVDEAITLQDCVIYR